MPVYIAEIAPQNMRGSLGSVNQVSGLLCIDKLIRCQRGNINRCMIILSCFSLFDILGVQVACCDYWNYAGIFPGALCKLEGTCCNG